MAPHPRTCAGPSSPGNVGGLRPLQGKLQERRTTLGLSPPQNAATRRTVVRSGLWWQTAMGQIAVQVFDGFDPISSFQKNSHKPSQKCVFNTYIWGILIRSVQRSSWSLGHPAWRTKATLIPRKYIKKMRYFYILGVRFKCDITTNQAYACH